MAKVSQGASTVILNPSLPLFPERPKLESLGVASMTNATTLEKRVI